jgi:hypothetical protein
MPEGTEGQTGDVRIYEQRQASENLRQTLRRHVDMPCGTIHAMNRGSKICFPARKTYISYHIPVTAPENHETSKKPPHDPPGDHPAQPAHA